MKAARGYVISPRPDTWLYDYVPSAPSLNLCVGERVSFHESKLSIEVSHRRSTRAHNRSHRMQCAVDQRCIARPAGAH